MIYVWNDSLIFEKKIDIVDKSKNILMWKIFLTCVMSVCSENKYWDSYLRYFQLNLYQTTKLLSLTKKQMRDTCLEKIHSRKYTSSTKISGVESLLCRNKTKDMSRTRTISPGRVWNVFSKAGLCQTRTLNQTLAIFRSSKSVIQVRNPSYFSRGEFNASFTLCGYSQYAVKERRKKIVTIKFHKRFLYQDFFALY